jgi:hypothetical protein
MAPATKHNATKTTQPTSARPGWVALHLATRTVIGCLATGEVDLEAVRMGLPFAELGRGRKGFSGMTGQRVAWSDTVVTVRD